LNFKKFKLLLLPLMTLLLSACAARSPVTTDYDIGFDFSSLKTYAWVDAESEDKVITLDDKRHINAISTILNRKGFVAAAKREQADFLLKIHTVTDKKINVDHFYQSFGYYPYYYSNVIYPYGYAWPYNSSTVVREYKIGTLVLDIVDPAKKQVIWRGTFASRLGIYKNRTPEERASLSLANAEVMLANFPPSPVAQP